MVKNGFDIDVTVKCLEERITQAQLAEMVGTSAPYISRLINNKNGTIISKTFVEELEALGYGVRITYERRSSELVIMLIELIEDPGYILMYEANRPLSR